MPSSRTSENASLSWPDMTRSTGSRDVGAKVATHPVRCSGLPSPRASCNSCAECSAEANFGDGTDGEPEQSGCRERRSTAGQGLRRQVGASGVFVRPGPLGAPPKMRIGPSVLGMSICRRRSICRRSKRSSPRTKTSTRMTPSSRMRLNEDRWRPNLLSTRREPKRYRLHRKGGRFLRPDRADPSVSSRACRRPSRTRPHELRSDTQHAMSHPDLFCVGVRVTLTDASASQLSFIHCPDHVGPLSGRHVPQSVQDHRGDHRILSRPDGSAGR